MYGGAVEEMMCGVSCVCYKGGIMVMDGIWRRLCVSDLRKGNLFVSSWARVCGVRLGCIFSELLMYCFIAAVVEDSVFINLGVWKYYV